MIGSQRENSDVGTSKYFRRYSSGKIPTEIRLGKRSRLMMIIVIDVIVIVVIHGGGVVEIVMMMVVITIKPGAGALDIRTVSVTTASSRKPAVDAIQVQLGKLVAIQISGDDILAESSRFSATIRFDLLQQKGQELGIPVIFRRPQDPRPSRVQISEAMKKIQFSARFDVRGIRVKEGGRLRREIGGRRRGRQPMMMMIFGGSGGLNLTSQRSLNHSLRGARSRVENDETMAGCRSPVSSATCVTARE